MKSRKSRLNNIVRLETIRLNEIEQAIARMNTLHASEMAKYQHLIENKKHYMDNLSKPLQSTSRQKLQNNSDFINLLEQAIKAQLAAIQRLEHEILQSRRLYEKQHLRIEGFEKLIDKEAEKEQYTLNQIEASEQNEIAMSYWKKNLR